MSTVADRLGRLLDGYFGDRPPVRLRAWDGSETGPADAPVIVVRSRRALRRLLWQPSGTGLAEAYIAGELDIEGDLPDGLGRVARAVRERGSAPGRPRPRALAAAAATALRLGALGPRPAPPGVRKAKQRGALHSTGRDRAAISHHYDLSNDWYAELLDPSMAYSCGYWTQPETEPATEPGVEPGTEPDHEPESEPGDVPGGAGYGIAEAQRDKLELVCRKLALTPGARLLDMGCGWGSLSLYAAREFKARVTAVTLSREQRDFVAARIAEQGLGDLVEVRLSHYRDLGAADGGYDAVSAIEMGEHVGEEQYPDFAARLHALLRPRGRLLVQQMSRGADAPGGGAFIESYIVPDMHMRPVGRTVDLLEDAGLEVRSVEAMREHYVRTIAAWYRTLEERRPVFAALAGEPTVRVWQLYLAGSMLTFAERRMGVDQILAVRPEPFGGSGLPATPHDWYVPVRP
ncbi:cyclopropane-fatty-acyl-phospholipid synthase family protein [Streptomyces sp. NPDC088194]|uniref:cyclopropane-fatty-acyl-phospholipid synthase family protein n=1 Tax=Streptomyces sp. NPDC088194 TaxID=3154931 RepID=UPI00344B70D7